MAWRQAPLRIWRRAAACSAERRSAASRAVRKCTTLSQVLGDNHACAFPSGNPPSPVAQGSSAVIVAGRPVARVGDVVGCGAQVILGAFTTEVGG